MLETTGLTTFDASRLMVYDSVHTARMAILFNKLLMVDSVVATNYCWCVVQSLSIGTVHIHDQPAR